MDVVWLILDSLSYSATPFCPDGPDTMPRLTRLADERGVVFSRAYAPGTKSPSSHGSFFTGELPSRTGMHEAYPYFDGQTPTIAGVLGETHETALVTSNSYVLNGLDVDFQTVDDLVGAEYMLFEEATDPRRFANENEFDSRLEKYEAFLREDGRPFRSLANGLNFKRIRYTRDSVLPQKGRYDDARYQYSQTVRRSIEGMRAKSDDDVFVVANCMDIHPPLDATDDALEQFCPGRSREDLPIGINGKEALGLVRNGDAGNDLVESMYDLVKAATWDVDRHLGPLVESLVDDGAFVVVTADHGIWFRREHRLDEELIHVPLLLFAPDEPARTVHETVNIRSLPVTTIETIPETVAHEFTGDSLFDVTGDRMSITEYIHSDDADTSPVDAFGSPSGPIVYDVATVRGDTRVDFREGEFHTVRGDGETAAELRELIAELRSREIQTGGDEPIEYDETTEERLRQFGYLS